jgi:MFS family permease
LLLVGITYGLVPYGGSSMGWGNPWVMASLLSGGALFVVFPFVESRVRDPMFQTGLFKNRMFSMGNLAGTLGTIARGGMLIMLIIMLQGIWLPLHGVSYSDAPFWAGIYLMPLALAIALTAPISGWLCDKHGARVLSTAGMLITGAAFIAFTFLPADFSYTQFAMVLVLMGIGNGLFLSPNTASIMNSVPSAYRGAASGMRATLQNCGLTVGQAIFFAIIILSLNVSLPAALSSAVTDAGAPAQIGEALARTPASSAIFSAFLGYNPMQAILHALPSTLLASTPSSTIDYLTGSSFFPTAFSSPFMVALREVFYLGALLCFAAAVCSALRGGRAAAPSGS